jgi:ABC-type phosphate/phosphonate transport system permease subunit
MELSIESDFLTLSKKGKNDWWRILLFVATLIALSTIASLILDNIEFPDFTDKESEFTLDIVVEDFTFSIVLIGVFFAIKLIHKRSFSTLNGTGLSQEKEFFEGITIWGLLIVIGSLINQKGQWEYYVPKKVEGLVSGENLLDNPQKLFIATVLLAIPAI